MKKNQKTKCDLSFYWQMGVLVLLALVAVLLPDLAYAKLYASMLL